MPVLLCCSLPTAAQSFVKLNHAQQLRVSNLSERQLGLKQIPVRVESVELRIDAALVTYVCQPLAILQCCDEAFLLDAALASSLMRNQRIGHLGEGGLD